jgi:hypothetical protein
LVNINALENKKPGFFQKPDFLSMSSKIYKIRANMVQLKSKAVPKLNYLKAEFDISCKP